MNDSTSGIQLCGGIGNLNQWIILQVRFNYVGVLEIWTKKPLRPSSTGKGWGGFVRDSRLKSQWGQIYLSKKKKKWKFEPKTIAKM